MPADERTHGLILRTRPLTETSLIVHWITPNLGRLATVAKGARRPRSPFRGKLDLFFTADFTFARSRRSELHTLREIALERTHTALRLDYARLEQASHATRLLERATEPETPIPELYDLLLSFVAHLDSHPPTPVPPLAFMARFLSLSGLGTDPDHAPLPPDLRALLRQLLYGSWELLQHLHFSQSQQADLSRFLLSQVQEAFGIRAGFIPPHSTRQARPCNLALPACSPPPGLHVPRPSDT